MVADSLLHSNRFGNEKRTLKSETEAGKFINCPIGLNRPDKIVTGKIVSGGLIRHVTNLIGLIVSRVLICRYQLVHNWWLKAADMHKAIQQSHKCIDKA
jgi:hypothetical protein